MEAARSHADYRLREMRDAFTWFEDQLGSFIDHRRSS
jgi:hypothetical protein